MNTELAFKQQEIIEPNTYLIHSFFLCVRLMYLFFKGTSFFTKKIEVPYYGQ